MRIVKPLARAVLCDRVCRAIGCKRDVPGRKEFTYRELHYLDTYLRIVNDLAREAGEEILKWLGPDLERKSGSHE